MAGTDAIRSTAIARGEVRAGLDRLQYHLERGARGKKGVAYEVRRLDALHRQATRLGGRAVGTTVVTSAGRSFGADALTALNNASPTELGRVKSSILADFSADGLEPARSQVTLNGQEWVWVANSSACPSCLSEHGKKFTGPFVPMHPSCLCIPEPARVSEARPLKLHEIISTQEKYGDPRYAKLVGDVKAGRRRFNELGKIEAVNKGKKGKDAVVGHRAQGIGQQIGLGGAPEEVLLPNADEALAAATKNLDEAAQLDEAIAAATSVVDDGVRIQHPSAYGVKVPRMKARKQLIEDAFEKLNELPAAQRKTIHELLEDLYAPVGQGRFPEEAGRGLGFKVATNSTKGQKWLGKAAVMQNRSGGALIPGTTRLDLALMRRNADWLDWLKKNNKLVKDVRAGRATRAEYEALRKLEPDKWRLASADELADVIVHEMGHLEDYTRSFAGNYTAASGRPTYNNVPQRIRDEVRKMAYDGRPPSVTKYDDAGRAIGVETFDDVGPRLASYEYAASSQPEMVAELHRFYFRGVGQTEGALAPGLDVGDDVFLTAAEWRAKHPVLVEWLEETYGLTPPAGG